MKPQFITCDGKFVEAPPRDNVDFCQTFELDNHVYTGMLQRTEGEFEVVVWKMTAEGPIQVHEDSGASPAWILEDACRMSFVMTKHRGVLLLVTLESGGKRIITIRDATKQYVPMEMEFGTTNCALCGGDKICSVYGNGTGKIYDRRSGLVETFDLPWVPETTYLELRSIGDGDDFLVVLSPNHFARYHGATLVDFLEIPVDNGCLFPCYRMFSESRKLMLLLASGSILSISLDDFEVVEEVDRIDMSLVAFGDVHYTADFGHEGRVLVGRGIAGNTFVHVIGVK